MRWTRASIVLAALCVAVLWLHPGLGSADDKRLAIFSPQINYSVAIIEREGHTYVGLNELLDPLGHPEIRVDGGKVRVRAGEVEAELREGKSKMRIGRGELDLGGKVLIEENRALVPLHTVPLLLGRLLNVTSDLH
jgi:hypothetical protein